jgi:hypothetical protein
MRIIRTWPTLLVAALVLSGCAGTGPAGGVAVSPPSGAGALVLRVTVLSGLLQPGGAAATPPSFALYGEGRLIAGPTSKALGGWPEFTEHQVGGDDVRRLLQQAADAGLLDGTASGRSASSVPDESALVLTVASTTARRTTTVPRSDGPASRLYDALAALSKGAGTPYRPSAVAVISTANADPSAPVRAWPLPNLEGQPLSGLNAGARCTVLTANDVTTVRAAAEGATGGTLWRSADQLWALSFRPLLPDEADCAAL